MGTSMEHTIIIRPPNWDFMVGIIDTKIKLNIDGLPSSFGCWRFYYNKPVKQSNNLTRYSIQFDILYSFYTMY